MNNLQTFGLSRTDFNYPPGKFNTTKSTTGQRIIIEDELIG